ncbi:HD domain-containing protein [Clostridium oceanicum]|uniref:HD domain-containing protein n=1 Tax=Clostridium oceanicum TaxID=1543 RepID=A0ABP3V8Y3_9CLOT
MKKTYVEDMKYGEKINSSFMVFKKLRREKNKNIMYIGDKTGDFKCSVIDKEDTINLGDVIHFKSTFNNITEVQNFKRIEEFKIEDYLPTIDRPIEEIMDEIKKISKEEFKSKDCIKLNDYFFKNEEFLAEFKKGIGGISQHHNYIGGLAEHTLNVMYLAKILSYRYDCKNKEIAILAAKLHDIGKIEELSTKGPFTYTLRGEMESHIVIGVSMLEKAFSLDTYSEEFKQRIKGCLVQHHGKIEYGSPRKPNTEEAFIVHYADYVDANMNKIHQVKKNGKEGTWTQYDRRIEGKLYI